MGKKTSSRKSNTKSVKIQNKFQNKVNKRKKKTKNKNKETKNSIKATNKSLALQRAMKEEEENGLNGENEDEILPMDMMDDESLEYMSKNFSKKRKNKKELINNDSKLEDNYKPTIKFNRNDDDLKKRKKLLPIKGEKGLIEQYMDLEVPDDKKNKKVEIKENGYHANVAVAVKDETPKTTVEVLLQKKLFLDNTRDKIGLLARAIIENPQAETKKLKELRTMLATPEIMKYNLLKKLVMVSLTEIFKDIVPGYKIRIWSEKENEQQVSKDVKEVKDYEHTLVKQYKMFIDYLELCLKIPNKKKNGFKPENIELMVTAARCLSDLIQKLSHFNHAVDIIQIIVKCAPSKHQEVSEICCECIKNLFSADRELEISLEVIKKISKMLKQRSFGVKPEVLNTLLSLNLKEIKLIEEDKKKLTHKEKMKLSRTERKKLKDQEQLEIDLDQRKLSDKLQEKSKLQTKILEQLFLNYFKILKTNANLKLIPCVLEGLAKFAHLISLDFFDDLVTVMHKMVETTTLPYRARLHCVKTVFIVLSGQGESLTIDPLRFYTSLYNIILELNATSDVDNTLLIIECIEMMFFKRKRQIPPSRLMAFIKRLSTIALQLDPTSSALIQHTIRKLIALNKSTDLLFDIEYQFNGVYNPELTEPDYANAQNSVLWEYHLLSRHYDETIRSMANEVIKQSEFSSQHSKITNDFIVEEFRKKDKEIINNVEAPFIKHKTKKNKKKFKNKNSE